METTTTANTDGIDTAERTGAAKWRVGKLSKGPLTIRVPIRCGDRIVGNLEKVYERPTAYITDDDEKASVCAAMEAEERQLEADARTLIEAADAHATLAAEVKTLREALASAATKYQGRAEQMEWDAGPADSRWPLIGALKAVASEFAALAASQPAADTTTSSDRADKE